MIELHSEFKQKNASILDRYKVHGILRDSALNWLHLYTNFRSFFN